MQRHGNIQVAGRENTKIRNGEMSKRMWKLTITEDPKGLGRKPGELTTMQDELRKFLFFCKVVPYEFLGTPKEKAETKECRIQINITASCVSTWRIHGADSANDLLKASFGIGMMELKKLMEGGGVPERLPVIKVDSTTYGKQCPVDPSSFQSPIVGADFDLEIEQQIRF
jgi:hypothetical protein